MFLGLELLSIPLYVLCAPPKCGRERSLESGLKYLIIGSVGSATLLYGLALIYGATGATDFTAIATALASGSLATDPLTADGDRPVRRRPLLQGLGRALPPVDAGRLRGRADADHGVHGGRHEGRRARRVHRLFDVALIDAQSSWGPAVAVLAAITIIVGNVGALGQSSLKRMLAYSSVGPGRLHARRGRRRDQARASRRRSSTWPSTWR